MSSTLEQLYQTSHLYGGNASYIEAWYEAWLEDPGSVPAKWRQYFESLPASESPETGHLTTDPFAAPGVGFVPQNKTVAANLVPVQTPEPGGRTVEAGYRVAAGNFFPRAKHIRTFRTSTPSPKVHLKFSGTGTTFTFRIVEKSTPWLP